MRVTPLLAAAALGALLGAVVRPHAAQASEAVPECENNQCNLQSGNCFLTDIAFDCKEILGSPGCDADKCKP